MRAMTVCPSPVMSREARLCILPGEACRQARAATSTPVSKMLTGVRCRGGAGGLGGRRSPSPEDPARGRRRGDEQGLRQMESTGLKWSLFGASCLSREGRRGLGGVREHLSPGTEAPTPGAHEADAYLTSRTEAASSSSSGILRGRSGDRAGFWLPGPLASSLPCSASHSCNTSSMLKRRR